MQINISKQYKYNSEALPTSSFEEPITPKSKSQGLNYKKLLLASGLATVAAISSLTPKAFSQEVPVEGLGENSTQQTQLPQPGQPSGAPNPSYNINYPYSSQYPSYPNQQNRNSSIPTIRIYGDFNSLDSNSKSGINSGNQSQNGFKAGVEISIPFGSAPETVDDINRREQTRTETLKKLTDQINKLCTSQNLILTQDQCKQLKDDVFNSIKESMKNLKK